jgi:hypothetical protein
MDVEPIYCAEQVNDTLIAVYVILVFDACTATAARCNDA